MMSALTGMNVSEELLAFMSQNALQGDSAWATPLQIAVLDAISCSLARDSFGLRFLFGEFAADEEGLELEDPIHSFLPCQRQEDAVA
jgi:hypothetical protein